MSSKFDPPRLCIILYARSRVDGPTRPICPAVLPASANMPAENSWTSVKELQTKHHNDTTTNISYIPYKSHSHSPREFQRTPDTSR